MDNLLYILIFGKQTNFDIELSKYIEIDDLDFFIDEVKLILKKSNVEIIYSKITVENESIIWKLKINK